MGGYYGGVSQYRHYMTVPLPNQVNNTAHSMCSTCNGLINSDNSIAHDNFHATFTNRTDGAMAKVLWCDPGNHAFKADSRGSIHYQGTEIGENGEQQTASVDACAEHNPFAPQNLKDAAERLRLTAEAESELKGHNRD